MKKKSEGKTRKCLTLLGGRTSLLLCLSLKNKVTEQPLFSSYYLEKGNFLKIDNVTLGYTFNFKNNKYVRNLRIYGNVTNLATITGYSGLTPDVNVTGLQAGIEKRGSYPTTRTFTFGVNFGF